MARRSTAACHLWHQVGDYLEHALHTGASFDEAIAVLRDRAKQLEAHKDGGTAPDQWRSER